MFKQSINEENLAKIRTRSGQMINSTPALRPDQVPCFLRAIKANKITIQEQIKAGRICDADYWFVTSQDGEYSLVAPGRHTMDTCRSSNDFVAGALIGALPFMEIHGSDGITIDSCGNIREVELKLCMKSASRYEITENNSINIIGGTGGFKSDCAAYYEIINNINKKNVDTYLVVFDKDSWELVCIYLLTGEKVIELLSTIKGSGKEKTSRKRSISLSAFMKYGKEFFLDYMDSVGVTEWERRIYDRYGRDPLEASGYWNDERKARLTVLWTTGVSIDLISQEFKEKTPSAIRSHANKILKLRRP